MRISFEKINGFIELSRKLIDFKINFLCAITQLNLKLESSQSWVLNPMIHIVCIFREYQTAEVPDHSFK